MEIKLSKKIKLCIKDLLLSSTSHGIPNIIRSNQLSIKILWIISTLISSGFCAYLIISNILNYYKYEVMTKIRFIDQANLEMPTITICNINYFTSHYAAEYINNNSHFKNYAPDNYFMDFYLRYGIKGNSYNKDWGETKEKLIWRAEFQINTINLSQFSYFYHPEHGNCYKINSGYDENGTHIPLITTTRPGRLNGIILFLNTSINEDLNLYNFNTGAIIFIHNKSESPLNVDGIALSPGTTTNVALHRTLTINKPKPYSSCDGNTDNIENYNSDFYKMTIQKNGQYNQKICMQQCYQNVLSLECNCIDPIFESYLDYQFCAYNDKCLYKVFLDIFNISNRYCFDKCPLECEKSSFLKTISFNRFGNEKWNDRFKEYYRLNSSDMTLVNVYYEALGYTEITENESIDFVALVSNFGGIAGLFLGVSFLSFVELIELLFHIFLILSHLEK